MNQLLSEGISQSDYIFPTQIFIKLEDWLQPLHLEKMKLMWY